MTKLNSIKVIAFDADDTLWDNQNYFEEANTLFCQLMAPYMDDTSKLESKLLKTEINNSEIYGFGAKSFILSMIETALKVSNNQVSQAHIGKMIDLCKSLLNMQINVIEGVEQVLSLLKQSGKYQLVVATKGDLVDQQRKLDRSGLSKYFDYVDIMSNKEIDDYRDLLETMHCQASEFLMVGNSMKSDILPVIKLGGYAVHIPFHLTWANEVIDEEPTHHRLISLDRILELPNLLPLQ